MAYAERAGPKIIQEPVVFFKGRGRTIPSLFPPKPDPDKWIIVDNKAIIKTDDLPVPNN